MCHVLWEMYTNSKGGVMKRHLTAIVITIIQPLIVSKLNPDLEELLAKIKCYKSELDEVVLTRDNLNGANMRRSKMGNFK